MGLASTGKVSIDTDEYRYEMCLARRIGKSSSKIVRTKDGIEPDAFYICLSLWYLVWTIASEDKIGEQFKASSSGSDKKEHLRDKKG